MRGIICYYSITGNTKLAFNYIAKKLSGITFDYYDITKEKNLDLHKYDIVGFATFTDAWEPPLLFKNFINNLPQQNNKLAFLLNTYGFISGKTLRTMNKLVVKKGFIVLNGHSLHTPENYPPMIKTGHGFEDSPNEKEMYAYNKFITELSYQIDKFIKKKEISKKKIKIGFFNSILPKMPQSTIHGRMGIKAVDENLCTECGFCEKNCPYNAITLNPKPVFDNSKCNYCWACYNKCPKKAVYTSKYKNIAHYPRPKAKLEKKLSVY